jgi:hypothetical protein
VTRNRDSETGDQPAIDGADHDANQEARNDPATTPQLATASGRHHAREAGYRSDAEVNLGTDVT